MTLTNPGATISGSVTLNATVTGSGATQVVFGATPAGGGSWSTLGTDTSAPWSTTFDSTHLADGVYDLRATVSDNLGNTSSDVVASVRIDNTAPRVISSVPAEGSTVTSANAIELVTSEPATPLNVTLDGHTTVAPVISGTQIDYGTGALATGAHTLAGELQDSTGKRAPFRVHFTVYAPGSSTPAPPVDKNTSSGSSTTVSSTDGFAAATMPAGAWTTSGSDWIVLRITPLAAPSGADERLRLGAGGARRDGALGARRHRGAPVRPADRDPDALDRARSRPRHLRERAVARPGARAFSRHVAGRLGGRLLDGRLRLPRPDEASLRVRLAPRSPGAEPAAERARIHGLERTDAPLDSGLRQQRHL